jgi:hypothetical protein
MSESILVSQIDNCASWEELVNLLDQSVAPNGKPFKLAGYNGIVDSHFVRDRVLAVSKGNENINFITRNYGLRAKAIEFIELDNLRQTDTEWRASRLTYNEQEREYVG